MKTWRLDSETELLVNALIDWFEKGLIVAICSQFLIKLFSPLNLSRLEENFQSTSREECF